MIFSQLRWPVLLGIYYGLLAVGIYQTQAAVSQESQLLAIQALVQNSRFSDTVDMLSQLPQVQKHARERQFESQTFISDVSPLDSLLKQSALQHLHQLCLDAAEHLAPRVIHSCFDYIVQQDQERSSR